MNEALRDAVKYISDSLKDDPDASLIKLIDEASQEFDLNPMQQEFLTGKFILNR